MPGRFLEIPVFLGDYFIMPHPVHIMKTSCVVRPTRYASARVQEPNFIGQLAVTVDIAHAQSAYQF